MKHCPSKGILTAAVIAARTICDGQVYNQSIPSFAERSQIIRGSDSQVLTFPTISYRNDEVSIASESDTFGTNSSYAAWIVSTNTLARQPRWDGISNDIPLTVNKACVLALPQIRKQFPDVQTWTVESISLRKPVPQSFPDVWCYDIIFEPRNGGLDKIANPSMKRAIILFDGTLISPTMAQ